jgi:hypothetical protein
MKGEGREKEEEETFNHGRVYQSLTFHWADINDNGQWDQVSWGPVKQSSRQIKPGSLSSVALVSE